jgi:enoyl-CoA hydratase
MRGTVRVDTVVSYRLEGRIATITMDDGKANVLSPRMLAAINSALDQAEADDAVVVLKGRAGILSAGFDLAVLGAGGPDALDMLRGGFELAERVLSFSTPVVIVCTGHAIAMGVFLLLSGDYRIGVTGPYKVTANEVAIGLTMPLAAVEVCRQRLTPACFTRAVLLAEVFSPEDAVAAGFVDRVVPATDVDEVAGAVAATLASLDRTAHAKTKARARAPMLAALRAAIEADDAALRRPGVSLSRRPPE